MSEKIYDIVPKFIIKSKTNNNEFCKQYFIVLVSESTQPALIIRKLVLSKDFELYTDYDLLKIYKNFGLFQKIFSIKLKTLNTAINKVNKELIKLKNK